MSGRAMVHSMARRVGLLPLPTGGAAGSFARSGPIRRRGEAALTAASPLRVLSVTAVQGAAGLPPDEKVGGQIDRALRYGRPRVQIRQGEGLCIASSLSDHESDGRVLAGEVVVERRL